MTVRSIDLKGDFQFGKGRNDYKKGIDAISQSLKTRLQSFLGDCFFDQEAGIDWFLFLGNKSTISINLAVSRVILNTENVTRIVDLNIDLKENNRELLINYNIETVFGLSTNTFQLNLGV